MRTVTKEAPGKLTAWAFCLGSPGPSTWGATQPEFPHPSCSHRWGLEKQREKPSVILGRMGGCWLKAKDLRPWLPVRLWIRRVHGRLALNPTTSRQSPWGRYGTCWGCSEKGWKLCVAVGLRRADEKENRYSWNEINSPEIPKENHSTWGQS